MPGRLSWARWWNNLWKITELSSFMPSQIRNCPLDTFGLHKIWLYILNSKIFETNQICRAIQVNPWQASAPPASLVPLLDICRSSHAWMDFAPSKPSPLNMVLDKDSRMVAKPELKCLHSECSRGKHGRKRRPCNGSLQLLFQLSWFIMSMCWEFCRGLVRNTSGNYHVTIEHEAPKNGWKSNSDALENSSPVSKRFKGMAVLLLGQLCVFLTFSHFVGSPGCTKLPKHPKHDIKANQTWTETASQHCCQIFERAFFNSANGITSMSPSKFKDSDKWHRHECFISHKWESNLSCSMRFWSRDRILGRIKSSHFYSMSYLPYAKEHRTIQAWFQTLQEQKTNLRKQLAKNTGIAFLGVGAQTLLAERQQWMLNSSCWSYVAQCPRQISVYFMTPWQVKVGPTILDWRKSTHQKDAQQEL